MPEQAVAKRYAEALYDVAREGQVEERLGVEMAELRQLWLEIPELGVFLAHPEVPQTAKEKLVKSLTEGMHPFVRNLLLLLVRKRRIDLLPLIGQEYLNTAEEQGQLVHVILRLARKAEEDELDQLRAELEKALGKPVAITVEEAPELLAGAELLLKGRRVDVSVAGRLERLAARLRG